MPPRPSPEARINTRSRLVYGWLLLVPAVLFLACTSPSVNRTPRPDNPLPPCPDTPNCERTSRSYSVGADTLFSAAQDALDALGPTELQVQPDAKRASAVYRVALIFKDDVDVAVAAQDTGSVLFVRSASRVGESDLGVNRRRVERFFQAVDDALP